MAERSPKPYDAQLADALARGRTLAEAAEAAGVSETTARRAWADLTFRRGVRETRADMLAAAYGLGVDAMPDAVAYLATVIRDEHLPDARRMRAVELLRTFVSGMADAIDNAARLADIEAAITTLQAAQAVADASRAG